MLYFDIKCKNRNLKIASPTNYLNVYYLGSSHKHLIIYNNSFYLRYCDINN